MMCVVSGRSLNGWSHFPVSLWSLDGCHYPMSKNVGHVFINILLFDNSVALSKLQNHRKLTLVESEKLNFLPLALIRSRWVGEMAGKENSFIIRSGGYERPFCKVFLPKKNALVQSTGRLYETKICLGSKRQKWKVFKSLNYSLTN